MCAVTMVTANRGILKAPICLTLEEQYESIIASAAAPSFAYVSSLALGSSLYRALTDSLSPLFTLTECSVRLFPHETLYASEVLPPSVCQHESSTAPLL